jgi:ABC-type nitrate/sulfonate/bicarbonate transport system permease component
MIAALALLGLFGALADWLLARALSLAFPWLKHPVQK